VTLLCFRFGRRFREKPQCLSCPDETKQLVN
jgi:hypothetical protein